MSSKSTDNENLDCIFSVTMYKGIKETLQTLDKKYIYI